jgi:hypothetical protein
MVFCFSAVLVIVLPFFVPLKPRHRADDSRHGGFVPEQIFCAGFYAMSSYYVYI